MIYHNKELAQFQPDGSFICSLARKCPFLKRVENKLAEAKEQADQAEYHEEINERLKERNKELEAKLAEAETLIVLVAQCAKESPALENARVACKNWKKQK